MDKIEVGKRIRTFREKRNMRPNELATKAGISPTYIYQIEKGERNPTVDVVYNICQYGFGITLEEFFRDPVKSKQPEDYVASLNDVQRACLNEFIKSLK